ncbi:hypothetical protein Tco_1419198 [Tanacetum coccineum]
MPHGGDLDQASFGTGWIWVDELPKCAYGPHRILNQTSNGETPSSVNLWKKEEKQLALLRRGQDTNQKDGISIGASYYNENGFYSSIRPSWILWPGCSVSEIVYQKDIIESKL